MKRLCRAMMICLCLLALLLALSACGAAGGSGTQNAAAPSAAPPVASADAGWGETTASESYAVDRPMGESGGSAPYQDGQSGGSVYRDENAKLIRTAYLRIQTTEFSAAADALDQLVTQCGGYYETANVYGGSYRDANAGRMGDYVIRIPAQQYKAFMTQSGNLGYIAEKSESSKDIGDQYYDTEARLKTQQAKHERLLSLLEQAATMEDIIQLETALSNTEYEIEMLSSTLNRYDSLVGYSTINLTLSEVLAIKDEPGQAAPLGEQMTAGLKASWLGLIDGVQALLIFISYNVMAILILAFILGGGLGIGLRRALRRKKVPKQNTDHPEI